MDSADCVVVGAGVIGLAVARALALAGREVIVIEEADCIGSGTSSRNSEVVHAGIYYPTGSLKARLCMAGRRKLLEYCREHEVPFRQCGKLIVATSEDEQSALLAIREKAVSNGVTDLRVLSAEEACALEPALACFGALLSPSTAIIDSHALMRSLQSDAEAAGAVVAFVSSVLAGRLTDRGVVIRVGGAETTELRCRLLVNSAGLQAPALARRISGCPSSEIPHGYFAKGNYFTLAGKPPFSRLIYPVPVPGGLGIHLTLDLGGNARFGPDVEWVDRIDYTVDPKRGASFYEAIRRYWQGIREEQLQPGYAGIRPKLGPPGSPAQDFVISAVAADGPPPLINLFGIESPGLTACLAIADRVVEMSRGRLTSSTHTASEEAEA